MGGSPVDGGGGPPAGEVEVGGRRARTLELFGGACDLPPVWLRIETEGQATAALSVPLPVGRELVLGAAGADIALDDPTVSARHARITHAGAALFVRDLGSRNGLRVGGALVPSAILGVGGSFDLGRTTVHVEPLAAAALMAERPLRGLVGASPPMLALAVAVRRLATLRLPVLLRGESGTGKDLVARALHDEGPRAGKPFFALNAATISRELAESELFGHVRGAFTGAQRDRKGAFREAHGGTLFLDEIAALPLDIQAKLLRVVEEGVIRPLGSEAGTRVDVRLVVATCEPLEAMVEDRLFRGDLYERLAVCRIIVPPLRERLSDLGALARHLLSGSELGTLDLAPSALAVLRSQRWPGNVRELRNVVVQAAVRAGGPIHAEHVLAVLADRGGRERRRLAPADALRLFEEAGRNVSAAARLAEVPRTTMRDLLRVAGSPGACASSGRATARASAAP